MSSSSTAWWRDCSPQFGTGIMDKTLRGQNDDLLRLKENGRIELAQALAVTHMRTGTDLKVLDVGCGMGRMSFALAEHFGAVLGVDVSPDLLRVANSINDQRHVSFELTDGTGLAPGQGGGFDTVFSYGVFDHLDDPTLTKYFADASGLMKPGGEFVFQVSLNPITMRTRVASLVRTCLYYCGKTEWHGWPTAPGFARRYRPMTWIEARLKEAGFTVTTVAKEKLSDVWIVATKSSGTK